MKHYLIRLIIRIVLLCIPFFALLFLYFKEDPFMVLRKYNNYDSSVVLNEGTVGWNMYKNNKDSIHYNSFIMGNSCTMAFQCAEWEKYLNNGKAFRLFGNAEAIIAVYKKLLALEKEKAEIKNVLLILDRKTLLKVHLQSGYCNILPPEISGTSYASYQMAFVQSFFTPEILLPYLRYKITGHYVSSMNGVINPYGRVRNPENNDALNPREKMIMEEGEQYWINRKSEFPERKGIEVAKAVIFAPQKEILLNIASFFRKHGTSVKIILNPDYKQEKISPKDVQFLEKLFGSQNVFDFTGINEYTADIHNYYEVGHYRPLLGNKLLERIYKQNDKESFHLHATH